MKKKIYIGIMLILLIIIISFVIYNKTNKNNEEDVISQAVQVLNKNCPEDTFCVPFKPECGHWRVTNYAPYKYCSIEQIDKNQCKFIENREWAVYCMALKVSDEECLDFVGDNRKLQAVCHISEKGQLLFPRETFDREVYVSETNKIIENPIFSIRTNCTSMTGDNCNIIIWEE